MTSDLCEVAFARMRINTANILSKKNGNHIRLNSSDKIQMYMTTTQMNYKKTFRLKKERNKEQIQEDEDRKTHRLTQFQDDMGNPVGDIDESEDSFDNNYGYNGTEVESNLKTAQSQQDPNGEPQKKKELAVRFFIFIFRSIFAL